MAFTYGSVSNCKVINGQTRKEYEARLGYQLNSQNKEKNTSSITLQLEVRSINSGYYTYGFNQTTTIDGTSLSASMFDMRNTNVWQVFGSRTFNVSHNSDGTYSATKSGSFTTEATSSSAGQWALKSGSASVSFSLPTIPRESDVSVSGSSFNIGDKITITTTKNSSSFTDKIKMSFGETKTSSQYTRYITENAVSPTIWDTNVDAYELYKKIPAVSRGICQLTVETYNGSTLIGSKTISFLLQVTDANPVLPNFEFEDINEDTVRLTGDNKTIILNYSNVQVTIPVESKAVAQKGATMRLYRFNNIEKDYSNTEDIIITSNGVTSGEFKVYAVDSRNNAGEKTKSATSSKTYTPLSKSKDLVAKRQNGVSESVAISFSGKIDLVNFGAVTNSIKLAQYRYKVASADDWSEYNNLELTIDESGNFSFNDLIKGHTANLGFDINDAYNIEILIKDELSQIIYTANLGSGTPHIAYAKNGVSIMGKYDESVGGLLQVGGQRIDNMAGGGGDALPIGSIFAYDGDTVPEGYEDAKTDFFDKIYPVGSIYMSVNSTNPQTLFGGTWEQIKDRFLLSAGNTYKAGNTGGSATHILSQNEMPSHSHSLAYNPSTSGQDPGWDYALKSTSADTSTGGKGWNANLGTFSTGGGQPHNNMPPYLTVYMWKRIG